MKSNETILKELQEIAPMLSQLEKKNFYAVPENYSVNFKNEILEQVKLSGVIQELKTITPELSKVKMQTMAEVPANYFNSFSGNLMKKIHANEVAAELKEIAPTLSEAGKINHLEVPTNYLNVFPEQMMKRIVAEHNTKEVSATQRWLEALNNVLENISVVVFKPKYSFAFAGAASILIVASMLFTQVQEQCADVDCKMAMLSNEELNTYLDNGTDEEIFETEFNTKQTSEQAIENVLSNVSDEELNNALLN